MFVPPTPSGIKPTQPVPRGCEFVATSKRAHMFVRGCFSRLFDRVFEIVNDPGTRIDVVAVTGERGVGMSFFLAWLVVKLRQRISNAASLTVPSDSTVLDLPSVTQALAVPSHGKLAVCGTRIFRRRRLVLLDGVPTEMPRESDEVLLCGTSRIADVADWVSLAQRDRANPIGMAVLELPMWTLSELVEARMALDGKLDPGEYRVLQERFDTYGGVADLCLDGDPSEAVKKEVFDVIMAADDMAAVRQLMRLQVAQTVGAQRRLMRMHPERYWPSPRELVTKGNELVSGVDDGEGEGVALSLDAWSATFEQVGSRVHMDVPRTRVACLHYCGFHSTLSNLGQLRRRGRTSWSIQLTPPSTMSRIVGYCVDPKMVRKQTPSKKWWPRERRDPRDIESDSW